MSGTTDNPALKKLEKMMLQCSELDREINCFVGSVEEMTAQVCCIDVVPSHTECLLWFCNCK